LAHHPRAQRQEPDGQLQQRASEGRVVDVVRGETEQQRAGMMSGGMAEGGIGAGLSPGQDGGATDVIQGRLWLRPTCSLDRGVVTPKELEAKMTAVRKRLEQK
jgi:hypothetical protein